MTEISEVSIANGALTHLGDKLITSLTDNNDQARAVNARFTHIRDLVIRAHPWNSAKAQANLASETTTPTFKFTNQFVLPTNPYCLRVLEVEDFEIDEWDVQGRRLLIDASSINIEYLKRIDDPMQMDPMLVEAVSLRLAHAVCFRLTSSRRLQDDIWNLWKTHLKDARSINGMEGTPPDIESDIFAETRL